LNKRKILLTFAGFDPSSGAGVLLDVNTFRANGFHGTAILTSLTAQNTEGVLSIFRPPPEFVGEQYRALQEDMTLSGIKIGMLGSVENLSLLSIVLNDNADVPKVVDPVFRSTSGTWLFDKNEIPNFIEHIKGKVTLITPNTHEATLIANVSIKDIEGMKTAAEKIYGLCGFPCLITGGHLGDVVSDILYDGHTFHIYKNKEIAKKVHGTGCFLSSSILCYLSLGNQLDEACAAAISATRKAIERAEPIGKGQHIIPFP
jgi:hydroxymethylpyrimidine/phosphomethylpyrimidine kinase